MPSYMYLDNENVILMIHNQKIFLCNFSSLKNLFNPNLSKVCFGCLASGQFDDFGKFSKIGSLTPIGKFFFLPIRNLKKCTTCTAILNWHFSYTQSFLKSCVTVILKWLLRQKIKQYNLCNKCHHEIFHLQTTYMISNS